jgi:hypothetical protein
MVVLPDQGRWAYRVENGPVRMVDEVRAASEAEPLFCEAERRAQIEVERIERKDVKPRRQ